MKNLKTKSILACAVLASVMGAGMPVWAAGESISLEQFVAATPYNSPNNSASAMAQQYDGGGGATALGYNAKADAAFATALGWGAQATRLGATAIGSNSVATRDHALAVGDESKAEGENSTALGYMNKVNLGNSTAVGNHNTVKGSEGAAFGVGNNITGSTGIALGSKNVVSGDYAITLGSNSQAQEDYSVAVGSYAIANGVESMALGRDSRTGSSAVGAMAFGSSARANGAGALAVGSFSESAKRDYAVKYCKELIERVVTEPPEQGTPFERTVRAITGDNYEEWLAKDTDTFINDLENALPGGLSFKNAVMPVVAGNEDGNIDGTTASGVNAISIGASTKPQGNMASALNSIAIGTDARAEHANSVALGSNSVTSAENTISVGYAGGERRITNVAAGTADTDAATMAQLKAKSDYYVKGGNVRIDKGNNKPYLDLQLYNNTSGGAIGVEIISIDMSSLGGGGGTSSGDKILTPGTNIGFTEYVDTQDGNKPKYRVDLVDNVSGLTSLDVGTEINHIYLDKDGVSVTEATSLTTNHKTVGMTPESVYIGEGLYNTSSGSYEGVIYSSLSKDELKVNQKTYINSNGIDANGQKIANVAAGTTDSDGANYGQVKNSVNSLTFDSTTKKIAYTTVGNSTIQYLDLSSLADGDVYTKTETDALLDAKADTADVYSKTEVDTAIKERLGDSTNVTGANALSLGAGNKISGSNSTAVGTGLTITGNNSGAFGDPSYVYANNSYAYGNNNALGVEGHENEHTNLHVIGNDNIVTGKDTFVLGSNVSSSVNNAVILGKGSTATEDNVVSVGAPGAERKIVNVAKGTDAHDAVNLEQVQAMVGTTGTGEAFVALQNDVANMGSQIDRMGTRISKVGAGAAALAAMHPVYDEDSKLTFSAGLGSYRSEQAAAVGMFYRFSPRVMMNAGATVGNDNNMYNIGLNFALDRHVNEGLPSKAVMAKQLMAQNEKLALQDSRIAEQDAKIAEMKANHEAQIAQLLAMIEELRNK